MTERPLASRQMLVASMPCLKRRILKRSTVRKTDLPRLPAVEPVYCVEMDGCRACMLTARQEDDARHSGRHMPPQATQRRVGDLLHGRLVSTLLAGDDHVGFEQYSFQLNALLRESIKHGVKNNTRDVSLTALHRMR